MYTYLNGSKQRPHPRVGVVHRTPHAGSMLDTLHCMCSGSTQLASSATNIASENRYTGMAYLSPPNSPENKTMESEGKSLQVQYVATC